jgi:3-dehydroquinate dehydratase/shikimate dehydrogenase
MMQQEIQEAAKQGARLVELRVDYLARTPDFKRLLDNKPCPLVVTIRRPQDGGRWNGTEDARQVLLRQATVAGFDWIDLETDIANEIRRFRDVKRIISYHNCECVPDNLEQIYAKMCDQDPDVVKIAVMAQKPADNLRVLALLREAPKPTVAFCMGDIGFPTRLLSLKYGSPFTYAVFNTERSLAPGIPSFEDLRNWYLPEKVNRDTRVFGVVGDPVAHSLSPLIHNRAMRQLGINAMYLPFRVPRGSLPTFLKDFEDVPVEGYSVTIPHKEAALGAARMKDTASQEVQACNTLIRRDDGFHAFNTDAPAAIEALWQAMPPSPDGEQVKLSNWTVMILGAGGVARALAHVLQREGARLVIVNRTSDRAQQLAQDVGCRYVPWADRHNVQCDLLVNCTAVGMHPNVDEAPIHVGYLRPGMMVFDTIYTPENTLLIKEAKARGCRVLTGVEMFVRQAALQFQLFTGQPAPVDLMQDLVRKALNPLTWRGER